VFSGFGRRWKEGDTTEGTSGYHAWNWSSLHHLPGLNPKPKTNTTSLGAVSSCSLYGGTYCQFKVSLPRLGISARFAPDDDPASFEMLVDNKTKALYVETLGNPKVRSTGRPLCSVWTGNFPWKILQQVSCCIATGHGMSFSTRKTFPLEKLLF